MSPYFDAAYFDPTYFDTGGGETGGRGPKAVRRIVQQAPVPQDHEDDLVMVRLL